RDEIDRSGLPDFGGNRPLLAVAGTATTLATLELGRSFEESLVNGMKLPLEKIWQWRDRLAALDVPARGKLKGMQGGRADVLVAGLTILAISAEVLGAASLTISTRGVRYGVARSWEMF